MMGAWGRQLLSGSQKGPLRRQSAPSCSTVTRKAFLAVLPGEQLNFLPFEQLGFSNTKPLKPSDRRYKERQGKLISR